MSFPIPNTFTTLAHLLSLIHLSISSYHQASTVYSFREGGLFSPPLTFQPNVCQTPVGPSDDSGLIWFLPIGEGRQVVRGETPRYSICFSELEQSNLALGLGELVSSFAESKMLPVHLNQTSKEMLRKGTGWIKQKVGVLKPRVLGHLLLPLGAGGSSAEASSATSLS